MLGERRLVVFIPGRPATQGSTKSFRHAATGKIVTVSDNPNLKSWRKQVHDHVSPFVAAGWQPLDDAATMAVVFRFRRPAGHYGARGLLPSKADLEPTVRKNDIDKLLRGLFDGITDSGVWIDDGLAVRVLMDKVYCVGDERAGAEVELVEGRCPLSQLQMAARFE